MIPFFFPLEPVRCDFHDVFTPNKDFEGVGYTYTGVEVEVVEHIWLELASVTGLAPECSVSDNVFD